MAYIDSDKLIAEIKRLIKVNKKLKPNRFTEGIAAGYGDALSVITSLTSLQQEQLEVDLEEEMIRYDETLVVGNDPLTSADFEDIARHFYELGLKSRKE